MISTAPILLFSYKRLGTLKLTVAALQANYLAGESELFIFSDGPKNDKDEPVINEVRSFLREIRGFKKIHISESKKNKGLANSIIDGVTETLKYYERAIIIEDDLVTTSNFLVYMNHALEYYEVQRKVYSVSAYNYNFKKPSNYEFDTFLATRGCSWGWATWKSRWDEIDWNIKNYKEIYNLGFKKSFNISGTDLCSMLEKQKKGVIDSWAIRWYFNQWKQEKLTVYPTYSFINNHGFDKTATHTNVFNRYRTTLISEDVCHFKFCNRIEVNGYYQRLIQKKFSLWERIIYGRFMTMLNRLKLVN